MRKRWAVAAVRAWQQVVTGIVDRANSDSKCRQGTISQNKEGRGERLKLRDSGRSGGGTGPQLQKRLTKAATSGATAAVRLRESRILCVCIVQ